VKSLEQQLHEKDEELRELRKTSGKKTDIGTRLIKELSESGLPATAQTRLRKRFEASGRIDGIKEAIAEEKSYVRQVRASASGEKQGSRRRGDVGGDLPMCLGKLCVSRSGADVAAAIETATPSPV
jgi:hypothetical protein